MAILMGSGENSLVFDTVKSAGEKMDLFSSVDTKS
jgi:hypothetical protein